MLFRPRRRFLLAVSVLLCLSVIGMIGGCGKQEAKTETPGTKGAEPKAAEPPKMQKVKIGYLVGDQLHQYALPIGLEKGYFAEEGLEVEKLEFSSGGMVTQQFSELDVALLGISPVIVARSQGMDIVVVASLNHGGTSLVVDPSITRFEDLKDQPVATPGVATIQHNLFTLLEKKYNTPTKKLTVKVTDMAVFARNKEIKGAIAWEPWPAVVMEMAGFKRLLGSNDILEDQQCCVWATSRRFISQHKDVVEKLVKINAKATRYIIDHPEEAIKIIAKYSGRDESTIREAYKNMIYPWPPTVSEKTSKFLLQNLMDNNIIKREAIKPNVDTWWSELYDKSFEQELTKSGYIAKLEKEGVAK